MTSDLSIDQKRIAAKRLLAQQKLEALKSGETTRVYREDTGSIIDAPAGLSGPATTFLDDTQNQSKPSSDYWGFNNLVEGNLNVVRAVPKAIGAALVSTGSELAAGPQRRTSETINQALTQDIEEIRSRFFETGNVTEAEAFALNADIARKNDPFAFITDSLAGNSLFRIARTKTEKAARLNDIKEISNLATLSDDLRKSSDSIRTKSENIIKDNLSLSEDPSLVEAGVYKLFQGGTTFGVSIGLGAITKSPELTYVLFSGMKKNSLYLEGIDNGLSPDEAAAAADLGGFVEGALEAVGVDKFIKIGQASKGLRKHLGRAISEAVQETAQQLGEELIAQLRGVREVDVKGGLLRIGESAILGGIIGGGASVTIDVFSSQAAEDYGLPEPLVTNYINNLNDTAKEISAILANDIEAEFDPIKMEADKENVGVSMKIMSDFIQGKEINIEDVPEALRAEIQSFVEKGRAEIAAQEGANFLRVPKRPETLSEFLKRKGGLKLEGGEVSRFTRKETPSLKGVANKNGKLSLDEARALAVEEGFLTDTSYEGEESISTTQDLIDALEQESFGVDVVRDIDVAAAQERADIIDFNAQQDEQNQIILSATKEVKSFKAAFNKGVSAAKKDVKSSQAAIITALEKAGLDPKDRVKFIRSIKNIQTVEQLQKNLPDIERRVVGLLNAKAKRAAISGINKALKATKTKSQNKIIKSKFKDPQLQERFDTLRKLNKITKEEAQKILAERDISEAETGAVDPIENMILALKADRDSVSPEDAFKLLGDIKATIADGKARGKIAKAMEKTRLDDIAVSAANTITNIEAIDAIDQTTLSVKLSNTAKNLNSFQEFLIHGWEDILDITFNLKGVDNSEIIETLRVTDNFQTRKRVARNWQKSYSEKAVKALGFQKESQYVKKVRGDHKLLTVGQFVNARGENVLLQLNIAQIRQLWMITQDSTISDTLTDKKGNAFTEEMISAATDLLSVEDIALARERLAFYQRAGADINKAYSAVNGVNLPNNPNYSPIRREIEGKQQDFLEFLKSENVDGFFKEQGYRASVNNGSLRERTQNILPIKLEGDEAVMQRHALEMAHYVAFAEKIQEVSRIARNPILRKAILAKKGKLGLQIFDTAVSDFTRGHVREATLLGRFVNKLNSNFARSVLSLKPAIGVKQLSSIPAYAEFVTIPEFIAGVSEALINPAKVLRALGDSALLQERGSNLEKQIADIASGDAAKQFKKDPTVERMLGIFIELGDKGAIVVGGWSVYKAAIKRGLTHEQAIVEFERATSSRQQSADLDRLSGLQRSGALGRLFSQFLSAPNAYLRAELQAIRQLQRGKITPQEFGKKIAIYHLLLPALFQFISDGFRYEEDKQAVAMILGSLNGYFILGDLLKQGVSLAVGAKAYQSKGINFYGALNDATKGAADALEAGLDGNLEDFADATIEMSKAAGKLAGKPIEQGFNFFQGTEDYASGREKEGVLIMLQWPPGAVEGVSGPASSKNQNGNSRLSPL